MRVLCFIQVVVVFVDFVIISALAQQVTLSSSPASSVVEGQNLLLVCSYTGTGTITTVQWHENGNAQGYVRITAQNPCSATSALSNTSIYSVECRGNNAFALTIINVRRSRNNDSWQCQMLVQGLYNPSNNISVKVLVGITGVTMTSASTVMMISDKQATLQCQTSGGLPLASVTWFLDSGAGFIDVSSGSSDTSDLVEGLSVVTSTLRLMPTRNNNNLNKAFCSAQNVGSKFNSSVTMIDVLYGPDRPQCQYRGSTETGTIMITVGGTLSISCTSNSNPKPAGFQWTLPVIGTRPGSQLEVTNIQAPQSGSYIINVWNSMTPTEGATANGTNTTTITVDVQYSPTPPEFYISSILVSGSVKIIEGISKTIQCVSKSNPAASYRWTHGGMTSSTIENLVLSNPRSPSNAGDYECRAENTLTPTGGPPQTPQSSSSSLTLDILFPPRNTSFKYGGISGPSIPGNNISIVRGEIQPVWCVASSNPESSYRWEGQEISPLLNMRNIQATTTRTCNVTTTMVETVGQTKITTNLTVLSINVYYAPDIPQVTFNYKDDNRKIGISSVRVREGESFILQCSANSNPGSSYSWNDLPVTLAGIYIVNNISRTPSTQVVKCSAYNTMMPTFSSSVTGNNSTNININILYKPRVSPMHQRDIVRGRTIEQNCSYIPGNPVETSFKWTRTTNTGNWTVQTSQLLVIASVQRSDDSNYICQTSNVMNPTIGSNESGTDQGMFHLNVLFGPEKVMLTVQGHSGKKNVTVNENETHSFSCFLDSNPGSTIVIKRSDFTLSSNVNTLNFSTTVQSRCADAGLYTCTGNNEYGMATSDSIEYFVNCAARPSPLEVIRKNISSAQNIDATMAFYAQAYPAPQYVWQTCKDTCTNITSGLKYNTSSNGLVSNLTILNVTQEDYGEYRVIVKNNIGQAWTETFQLIPYDKPNAPKHYQVIKSTVTQTEATVAWTPGFNGGPQQTFHILYKIKSGGPWINISVKDSGDLVMNFTIQGLVLNTEYQTYMHSQNIIGASTNTEEDTFVTLKESTTTTSAGLIGGVAGGSLALILIGVIIAIFVLRKRQGGRPKKNDGFTGELMKTNREQIEEIPDEVQNPMYISAGTVTNETAMPIYASPMKKTPVQSSTDVYATVDVNKKTSKGAKRDIKAEKGKKKQDKHTRNDVYENPPMATSKKAYDNKGMDEDLYENNASVSTPKNVTADGLIYADLDFPNQPKGQKRLVIHGLDNKTDYAEVDLTRTADPLPDSDSEEKKSEMKK